MNFLNDKNNSNIFILIFVFISMASQEGNCKPSVDLSNVDFKNFRFFRYQQVLPNGQLRNVMPPAPSIHDHFNRVKAIGSYFRRLFLGNTGGDAADVPIPFHSNINRLKHNFQNKFGYRGEYLIESLGKGYIPSVA